MLQTIESITEFEKLRTEWNQVLGASRSNCFFLTWEWLYTWWKHLSENKRLFLVTARDEEELVAIAPLARKPSRVSRLWPFGSLEFLGVGNVGSDYLDLIIRQDKEQEVLPALTQYLAREKSLLTLAQINRQFCLAGGFAKYWRERGWSFREASSNVCPTIPLSGHTWDSYLATLGSEHRYNFRRKLKNLTKRFEVRFEPARSEEQRQEALAILLALHSSRWQERSDAFITPQLISFHDELSSLALQRGWLRLFTLRLDGKPVASLYGFQYNHVFYFYQSGFDPSYSKYSVGLITMGLAIQSAIADGAKEYDLLHGDEAYKFHWARETRELGRLELYPPGALGLAWKQVRGTGRGLKKVARNVLPPAVAEWLAEARRKRAVGIPYVAHSHQNRQLPCLTLDGDG